MLILALAACARALPESTDALTGLAELGARCFELRAGWDQVQEHHEAGARDLERVLAGPRGRSAVERLRLQELGTRARRQAWSLSRAGEELGALEARLRWLRGRYPGPELGRAEGQVLEMHLSHIRRRLRPIEEARRVARQEARALAPGLAEVRPPP